MKFHREGNGIIATTVAILVGLNLLTYFLTPSLVFNLFLFVSIVMFVLVVQFFRVPKRKIMQDPNLVVCPADGKVVVIEETEEGEYFKDKRLQISVFMSPLNVHVNWYPVGGKVKYSKYHPGKYLVAWHPKSSTENERTTVVVENQNGFEVLFRQIAGAVARRIVNYAKEGDNAEQAKEFGFIKFGSRIDIYLPIGSDVKVNIDDVVTGSETVLAVLPKAGK